MQKKTEVVQNALVAVCCRFMCRKCFMFVGKRIIVAIRYLKPDLQILYMENKLKTRHKLYLVALSVLLGFGSIVSQANGVQQDTKAIEVLKQMAAFK